MTTPTRPGGQTATRPLHFFWVLDCSGSMEQGGKIQTLNMAIRQAIPHMQETAQKHPEVQVLVRALGFSDGAQWHVAQPTPVADFQWRDLAAGGETRMGKALSLLADELQVPPMSARSLPPVIVLVSDGLPTDDFEAGLRALMAQPWGQKAVRLAIAIGQDADHKCLQKFIGNPEIRPLQANNPEALVEYFRMVSTVVLDHASDVLPPGERKSIVPPPLPASAIKDSVVW